MDLDDIIKAFIPKSARKKAKKKLKKKSLGSLLKELIKIGLALFLGRSGSTPQIDTQQRTKNYEPRQEQRREKIVVKKGPLYEGLQQARTYQQNIAAMMQAAEPDSMKRLRLEQVHGRVEEWVHMIEEIVTRAEAQSDDRLLTEERKRVPAAIKRLEKQLEKEKDPALRAKLEKTVGNRRLQLEQIEQGDRNRQMTELRVENTLAQIGIIYTQLHSGNFMSQNSNYERLSAEINDEILSLGDYLDTLGELQHDANR